MSVMGVREKMEREVLGTLCLVEQAYENLPEGFDSSAFEFPEYKDLYSKLEAQFFSTGKPVDIKTLERIFPQAGNLALVVTWALIPLNGRLRSRAQQLMTHRPLLEDGERKPGGLASGHSRMDGGRFQFDLLNGIQLAQMEIPEQAHLVKDLIADHSVNLLAGEEGCGKSLMAMNLAISVAVGAPHWLSYDIVKHGKVVLLNNELAFSDFTRRFKSMVSSLPAPGDIGNLITPKEVPPLHQCWDALNELCAVEQPCLVVLDCLYFAHDEDENDSSSMKALMRQFLALRDTYGIALLLVHHTKKNSRFQKMHNDLMRGSNVFAGATDTVLQMRRSASDEMKRILKPTKFRHVSDKNRKCRLLSLNPETLWFRDEGETDEADHTAKEGGTAMASNEIDFREVFKPGEQLSRKDILQRCSPLGYDERTIDRLLRKAKVEQILVVPRYGYYGLPDFDTLTLP